MAQIKDLNVAPYYDDFDENDDFHKILFRPGYAIQARELTNLQSILQNQIEKGAHKIYKEGETIIGGALSYEPAFQTLRLASTFSGETIDPSQFYSSTTPVTVTGGTTGIKARVIGFQAATATVQPTLYIQYIAAGTDGETTAFEALTTAMSGAVGTGNIGGVA